LNGYAASAVHLSVDAFDGAVLASHRSKPEPAHPDGGWIVMNALIGTRFDSGAKARSFSTSWMTDAVGGPRDSYRHPGGVLRIA
jgi:hypothetical protein